MNTMAIPDFANTEVWISLITLIFLEIVLGVDNIIFISISSSKLPKAEQGKATFIGLLLAMILRLILLFGVSYLIAIQEPWFHIDFYGIHAAVSGQSLLLLSGGIFLLYKSVMEIHDKLEGEEHHRQSGKKKSSFINAIIQIAMINIVFSMDSILTAIGMTLGQEGALLVMMIAVVISIIIMMIFTKSIGNYINEHPSLQMLGLSFLLLIGFMLILEGAHDAHLSIYSNEIDGIPKGYLYFAIAFSLLVEVLNIRLSNKNREKVQLRNATKEAQEEGLM
jgi:predicted tellurium resistance membrane protein TerC